MVEKYFAEHSQEWVSGGYESDGYGYPTALARMRRVVSILKDLFPSAAGNLVDLACGAGQLCLTLAEKGFTVIGVDQSASMISQAENACGLGSKPARSRLHFLNRDLLNNGLGESSYDVVSALGVIGYLPNDDVLFNEAERLLKPGGIFIVSCRNRLFNMVSISDYTLREIEQGTAQNLVQEIRQLLQPIPAADAQSFTISLACLSNEMVAQWAQGPVGNDHGPSQDPEQAIEARQQTPKGLELTAQSHNFTLESYHGVHPHLLMAGINRKFPPELFNHLSSALDSLAHLPASLIWNSVFIGVFRKPY